MKSAQDFMPIFGDFISKLKENIHLYAIILFGSQAKGTAGKYSDYDIVVIADFEQEFLERFEFVSNFAPFISIDFFCYTPVEFDEMFNSYHLTAIDSIGEGIPLYGEDFLVKYKDKYQDFVKRGMRKTKSVLIPPDYPHDFKDSPDWS